MIYLQCLHDDLSRFTVQMTVSGLCVMFTLCGMLTACFAEAVGEKSMVRTNVLSKVLFPVRIDGKYGYIDQTGSIVIKPQFSKAHPFGEGLALTSSEDGSYGYINMKGEIVVAPQFLAGFGFSEGLAAVETFAQKWGYIDKTGAFVISADFDAAYPFNNGIARVGIQLAVNRFFVEAVDVPVKCKWHYIDKTGERAQAPKMSAGRVPKQKDGKWGFEEQGMFVILPRFEKAQSFSEGLAAVKEGGKWGYINEQGEMVISPCFRYGESFQEGLAAVAVFDKPRHFTFIDRTGKVVIPPCRGSSNGFSQGLAKVVVDRTKIGYIDKTGVWVWKPTN